MLRILGFERSTTAGGHYRLVQPLYKLLQHGLANILTIHEKNAADLDFIVAKIMESDIIVFQRPADDKWLNFIKTAQKYGKTVVVDYDDDPFTTHPLNPSYRWYGIKNYGYTFDDGTEKMVWEDGVGGFDIESNLQRRFLFRASFRKADLVTCTTDILKDTLSKINPNTVAIPNLVDFNIFKPVEMKKKEIRIGWQGGNCVDDKTEILTSEGFKLFKDLNKDETVATLNQDTGELEYQKPTHYTDEFYSGKMHIVENKHIDYCVTPNHKMLAAKVSKCKNKDNIEYELIKSSDIHGKNFYCKKDAIWEGKEDEFFTIPKIDRVGKDTNTYEDIKIPMDDWLKFFGFWLAEGWTTRSKYKNQTGSEYNLMQVGICQNNEEMLLDFQKLLKPYFKSTLTKDRHQLRACNKQLWSYLSRFGGSHDKYIPKELLQLSKRQLKILLKWYIEGDGSVEFGGTQKTGRMRAWTVSDKLAGDLTEIALKIGWSTNVTNRGKRNGNYDALVVSFLRNDGRQSYLHPLVGNDKQKQIDYNGKIYCVTVPNHVIYVRRNGKCMWTGNSHYHDLFMIVPAIKKIIKKYDNVKFVFFGDMGFTSLFKDIPEDRIEWHSWVSMAAYPYKLMILNFDINLCPIVDDEFNRAKSSLKYIEASALKIPTIASNIPPYTVDITNNENGMLVDEDGWFDAIEDLVLNEKKRNKIANNAYDNAKENHCADKKCHLWLDAYTEALKRDVSDLIK